VVKGLKEVDEVEALRRQFAAVQIRSQVSDSRCEINLLGERTRSIDGSLADVDASERTEPESAALEDPIQVSRSAAKGQHVSSLTPGEEPFSHPVDPVRFAGSGDQVIVIEVHLWNARPGDPIQVVNEGFRGELRPVSGDLANLIGRVLTGPENPSAQALPTGAKSL